MGHKLLPEVSFSRKKSKNPNNFFICAPNDSKVVSIDRESFFTPYSRKKSFFLFVSVSCIIFYFFWVFLQGGLFLWILKQKSGLSRLSQFLRLQFNSKRFFWIDQVKTVARRGLSHFVGQDLGVK